MRKPSKLTEGERVNVETEQGLEPATVVTANDTNAVLNPHNTDDILRVGETPTGDVVGARGNRLSDGTVNCSDAIELFDLF